MKNIPLFLAILFVSQVASAQNYTAPASEPQANPAPTAPLQSANNAILQINNNNLTTAPTPIFTPTPAYQPQ
jgi:hypothetical protein